METNKIYISLGLQCLTPELLKIYNLRKNSYPFDWILSNPYFVYKILFLLLEDNMSISKIVREHFFRNDNQCVLKKKEHYIFVKKKNSCNQIYICNQKYNVVFPHDTYNEETINKYIRRFKRLKNNIINKSLKIQFIYISQSSLDSGNFTIMGEEVVKNVYENMNSINLLIKKYNKNSNILIFDSIQNEDPNMLNKDIRLYKISPKNSWMELSVEIQIILSNLIYFALI